MSDIQVPALAVNAQNDPFIPASSLPDKDKVSPYVQLWQPQDGGHVGFASGHWPGHLKTMPEAVGAWLLSQIK
jgi:predicted alpha/beta-fold hydrolase